MEHRRLDQSEYAYTALIDGLAEWFRLVIADESIDFHGSFGDRFRPTVASDSDGELLPVGQLGEWVADEKINHPLPDWAATGPKVPGGQRWAAGPVTWPPSMGSVPPGIRVGPVAYQLSSDRAGIFLQLGDGRVIRDRDAALAAIAQPDELDRRYIGLLPTRLTRPLGRRKQWSRRVVARSLVLEVLGGRIGRRGTARLLLSWSDHSAGELVRRAELGERLTIQETRRLASAEASILTTDRRYQTARDSDARQARHTPIATATSGQVRSVSPSSRRR